MRAPISQWRVYWMLNRALNAKFAWLVIWLIKVYFNHSNGFFIRGYSYRVVNMHSFGRKHNKFWFLFLQINLPPPSSSSSSWRRKINFYLRNFTWITFATRRKLKTNVSYTSYLIQHNKKFRQINIWWRMYRFWF